jgi:hypothetical protein
MDGCLCAFFLCCYRAVPISVPFLGGLSFVGFVGGAVFSVGLFRLDTRVHAKGAVFSWGVYSLFRVCPIGVT